ncbi:hypothetical protein GCM10027425_23370 [Alteromonas gracilis]
MTSLKKLAATALSAAVLATPILLAAPAEASTIRTGSGSAANYSEAYRACQFSMGRVKAAGNTIVRPCYYAGTDYYFAQWIHVWKFQFRSNAV